MNPFRPHSVDPLVITPQSNSASALSSAGPVIGFVGGVGSGKSAVARATAAALGDRNVSCELIDADLVGHETLTEPDVVASLRDAFGDQVIVDGNVDRRILGALVFGESAEHRAARKTLEAIVHPKMRQTFIARIQKAVTADQLVLFDAPILFETGWNDLCAGCVYVDVPDSIRRERAIERGWTVDRWQQTEASQWPLDKKRTAVESYRDLGLVVVNTGPIELVGSDVANWISNNAELPLSAIQRLNDPPSLAADVAVPNSR